MHKPKTLKPCPFCGGKAHRFTIEDGAEVGNVGGDVIACKKCECSTRVFFGEKEGIVEAWNDRAIDPRANRISAAQRRVVEAVHALIYSKNDAAYSRNLQALRKAYADLERAKGGRNG